MKKFYFFVVISFCAVAVVFSVSYTNNIYQQRARQYTQMAQKAFDEGEYDLATEYSAEAIKNTELSKAYVEKMLARSDAERQMNTARTRLKWAENINAQIKFPVPYESARASVEKGAVAFASEEYARSILFAQEALTALAAVSDEPSLPKYYVVRPWDESKDCYITISARSYVYNDKSQWNVLYDANKAQMRNPANPNLIYPGMKMEIPSIQGEYREGVYNAKTKYPVFNMPVVQNVEIVPLPPDGKSLVFPKYYTVRPWDESKDCYTTISARSYVYNDESQWNVLYDANKAQMRNPANPNMIYPGMKMEIPSIRGETREGIYDVRITYPIFN